MGGAKGFNRPGQTAEMVRIEAAICPDLATFFNPSYENLCETI
jgi:hypothetical protein